MQSPSFTLNKEIVGPLLSHRKWNSYYFHPWIEPLNSIVVTSCLFPKSLCKYSFSSFFVAHLEFSKNSSMMEVRISVLVGFSMISSCCLASSWGIACSGYFWMSLLESSFYWLATICYNSDASFYLSYSSSVSSSSILAVSYSTTACNGLAWL